MWKLSEEKDEKRTYTNSLTGSKSVQEKVYTDKEGNIWWSFQDLTTIPHTRNFAATKISSLYALGLSKEDLISHINGLKNILKSSDMDKYEKAYANVLEFEAKANNATDAIKQMSSLVCVYFTINDEEIDSWDQNLQVKKMAIIEADTAMHTFFLTRLIRRTETYQNSFAALSATASQMSNGK